MTYQISIVRRAQPLIEKKKNEFSPEISEIVKKKKEAEKSIT